MKKIFTFLVAAVLTASIFIPQQASAQSPEKMSYQAVIRNSSNALVKDSNVGMQISVLHGAATGTIVYTETHTPVSNTNGLVTLEIGDGIAVFGNFATINWAEGPYFLKTETDPEGGVNYTITGVSQLLSVPFALHAKSAETISGTIEETDPNFNSSIAAGITESDTTNWNNKLDAITGNETFFENWDKDVSDDFDGEFNSLIGKPTVVSRFINDVGYLRNEKDGSITNEIQDLQLTGNILKITLNGTATEIDLAPYLDNTDTQLTEIEVDNMVDNNGYQLDVDDGDVDDTNEIQDLQLTGNILKITLNGTATEIDLALYLDNTDTQLSETEVDNMVDNNGYQLVADDGDIDDTNELQDISLNGSDLIISDGSTVDLSGIGSSSQNLYEVLTEGNFGGNIQIKNIADPTDKWDAVTKRYVDSVFVRLFERVPAKVGDFRMGGVVFWVDPADPLHGLVCSVSDLERTSTDPSDPSVGTFEMEWGCPSIDIPGAKNTIIGTGQQNTTAILNGCTAWFIATYYTFLYRTDNDIEAFYHWFLPSLQELEEIAANKSIINATAMENGGTALDENAFYWSSSQHVTAVQGAWGYHFVLSSVMSRDKSVLGRVRAVHAF